MSINRQQRAGRDVRTVSIPAPQQVPQVTLVFHSSTGAQVTFDLLGQVQPPGPTQHPLACQLTGVPQVYRQSDGTYPTSAQISTDGLLLTLLYAGAAIESSDKFTVGPYDPAVRTAQGGWLAPGVVEQAASDPTVVAYVATIADPFTVQTDLPHPTGGVVLVVNPFAFFNSRSGEYAAYITPFLGTTQLNFAGGVLSGDPIQYLGPMITGNGGVIEVPDSAVHVL